MATQVRSQQELYDLYKTTVQSEKPELTDFEEGAINDIIAGVTSFAVSEAQKLIIDEFKKTFFQSADGPEVTGAADELEDLAVDHFGDDFARPDAAKSNGVVTFSRPDSTGGDVTILAGSIVKTVIDANGQEQRFATLIDVLMEIGKVSELSTDASVEAVVAGTAGNAEDGTVTVVETTLTDASIVVTNAATFVGGAPEEDDATYRETIKRKILELAGATKAAIESASLEVPGVEKATPIEFLQNVIEFIDATSTTVGVSFRIPRTRLYIADANGTASAALITLVEAAIEFVTACGVRIDVLGATAVVLNWSASITLNPTGPNFTVLSADPQLIEDTMTEYLEGLDIGSDFDRIVARNAILAIWGSPSGGGSDDITTFSTVTPSGDVQAEEFEKFIPGTVSIV